MAGMTVARWKARHAADREDDVVVAIAKSKPGVPAGRSLGHDAAALAPERRAAPRVTVVGRAGQVILGRVELVQQPRRNLLESVRRQRGVEGGRQRQGHLCKSEKSSTGVWCDFRLSSTCSLPPKPLPRCHVRNSSTILTSTVQS